jgi:hypothetical protein
MTPLAHRIAIETTKPLSARMLLDPQAHARNIGDFHCFECSDVMVLAHDLAKKHAVPTEGRLAFLPAPRTWLEFSGASVEGFPFAKRIAVLLEEDGDDARVTLAVSERDSPALLIGMSLGFMPLHKSPEIGLVTAARGIRPESLDLFVQFASLIYALLAMINSPRVIGRVTRLPHAGLQRRLAAAKGISGKFPLHATTRMKLHVCERVQDERGSERVSWLSGERALHWVRAHVRPVAGSLCTWSGTGAGTAPTA